MKLSIEEYQAIERLYKTAIKATKVKTHSYVATAEKWGIPYRSFMWAVVVGRMITKHNLTLQNLLDLRMKRLQLFVKLLYRAEN